MANIKDDVGGRRGNASDQLFSLAFAIVEDEKNDS